MTRQYRQLSNVTRAKISQAMKGRSFTTTHKENISAALKKYWQTVPNNPQLNNGRNEE